MPGRYVTATYRVAREDHPSYLKLLSGCETTMREEGLVTDRPFVRMRSIEDPEVLVEIFEWTDEGAFQRACENERVQAWWGRYEAAWKEGGFGMNAVPESSQPWAQYDAVD